MNVNPENKSNKSAFTVFKNAVSRAAAFLRANVFEGLSEKILNALRKFTDYLNNLYDDFTGNIKSVSQRIKKSPSYIKISGYLSRVFSPLTSFFSNIISPAYRRYSERIERLSVKEFTIFSSSLLVLNILFVWLISYQVLFARHYWEGDEEKRFRVKYGSNLTEIAGELERNGVIKNAFTFKMVVKLSGNEENIISRTYLFRNGMSNAELLKIMTDKSLAFTVRFTVLEGMRLTQIGRLCEKRLGLSYENFMREASSDSLISVLGFEGRIKNLEGFLFPDTYFIPVDITEKEIIAMLFDEFRKKILKNDEIIQGIEDNDYDLLKVIILASIVQGETQLKQEMPVIAGVYYNRLAKRMRLEADPTVQYVIPDGPKQRLLKEDLKIDSPYNTYRNSGLPPGPINNPGLDAVKSVIFPEKHDYLFFVATGKGGHKFAVTYHEHLKNVEEYRKATGQK